MRHEIFLRQLDWAKMTGIDTDDENILFVVLLLRIEVKYSFCNRITAMDFLIENEIRSHLVRDEKIVWTGKPKTGIVFRTSDIFVIPFSLLWFGFALFWEYNALRMGVSLFALFGIPFILIGLYMFAGRFFTDAWRRKNTLYAITDNRVIIKSGVFKKTIKSLNIRTLSDLTVKEKNDGSGTISFGPTDFRYIMFNGMGDWPGVKLPPSLEMIDDVRHVYTILVEQQRK